MRGGINLGEEEGFPLKHRRKKKALDYKILFGFQGWSCASEQLNSLTYMHLIRKWSRKSTGAAP